jgi:hypothetical protein
MDGKFNEVELLFIERTLELHGEYLCDLLREQIQDKHLIKDEDLLNSIDFSVRKYGIDPVLLISFFSYGRAVEIAWHKKKQNTSLWTAPNTNRMLWGMRENRKRTQKKDTRWYAKTAYGTINHLISVLATDFSEEEKNRLKQILEIRHEFKNR